MDEPAHEAGWLQEEAAQLRKKLKEDRKNNFEGRWYLVDPRRSKKLPYWDALTSICLIFTALVTPVEVAFLVCVPRSSMTQAQVRA